MNDEERSLQALLDCLVPEEQTAPEWGDVLHRVERLRTGRGPGRLEAQTQLDGRRRRLRIALPLSAGLAACAVALIFALRSPQPVAAGVSFREPKNGPNSGYIIATVTNPYAAQASLDAAFRQAGLDLRITLVPASPSIVGTVVFIDESEGATPILPLSNGRCVVDSGNSGHCPVGVKVPRDFTGSGYITLGRPAKPGEQYASSNDAFAPGEFLHCSGLIGETVAVATAELAKRGIGIQWREGGPSKQPVSTKLPPPDHYVVNGIPESADSVFLFVDPVRPSSAKLAKDAQMYDAGCS